MREEEKPEKQVEHTPDNASEESQKKEETKKRKEKVEKGRVK